MKLFFGTLLVLCFNLASCAPRTSEVSVRLAQLTSKKVILENDRLRISVLPNYGGKIYEFFDKDAKLEHFYQNSIYKEHWLWGKNQCREGNWPAVGGIEYSFPDQEHGCIYDQPFNYEISESKNWKSIKMHLPNPNFTKGLNFSVTVSLHANQALMKIESTVENPPGNSSQNFQYWINAMLYPAGEDPRNSQLEFFFSKNVKNVRFHSNEHGYAQKSKQPWSQNLANYDGWKQKGFMGFFGVQPARFQGVYSHQKARGLLRIFSESAYAKVWAFGKYPFTDYSDQDRQYLELWSGLTHDFWTYRKINEGQKLTRTEYWMPFSLDQGAAKNVSEAATRIVDQLQEAIPISHQ